MTSSDTRTVYVVHVNGAPMLTFADASSAMRAALQLSQRIHYERAQYEVYRCEANPGVASVPVRVATYTARVTQ